MLTLLVPALCSASSVETTDIRIGDVARLKGALASVTVESDLDRLAARTEVSVVRAALQGGDRTAIRTALSIVPRMEDPAPLLPVLVQLSLSPDRDIASRAAHAALLVASALQTRPPGTCVDQQCDLVELQGPLTEAITSVLQTEGVGPDVRRDILRLLGTDAGRTYLADVREPVEDLLSDPDPGVQVAAATLMTPPLDGDMLEELLDAAGDEDDPAVVGACLLAACAAMSVPEGEEERDTFEKRVERFRKKLQPDTRQAAPLTACLLGLGEPWAEDLASGLPAAEGE